MRLFALLMLSALPLAAAACGDSGDEGDATPPREMTAGAPTSVATTRPAPTATVAVSAEATAPVAGETVEVTGIVGSVDRNAGVISINRLSGATVDAVAVTPATAITDVRSGRRAELRDVRASDRIIARGPVDAETGTLVALDVEFESVIPGSGTGG